ncbi:MAG: helix-turn-helix transcriptional regulator [Clostridia bacterium]|nr:helix-turn-helix transcriptional regulator [Clostridia bacterium]
MELLLIKSGKIYVEHGNDLTIVSSGELMIIPPKALHAAYTLDEGVEYTVLMFDLRSFYNETEICKNLLPAIFDGKAVFNAVTAHPEIIRCTDLICSDEGRGTLGTISKIYQLLDLIYQNELLELRLQPKNVIVKEIMDYLEENAAQEINIATLCERFGYTSAHLCRKFKNATGLSPMGYLKIYRLEMAHKKLKNRNASISVSH